MKYLIVLSCLLAMMLFCGQLSNAQIPRTLSYQGVLTDSLGNPKPDGAYDFTFRLYDVESDGSALWTEARMLNVERGLFSTNLGDQVAFGSNVAFDRQYWLSVQVGSDPELSPRIPLSAVGYSLNSMKADTAHYARKAAAPSLVDSARIAIAVPDASITSAKIQNGTIQLADIGQNGATDGQVIKWNGSAWAAATDVTSSGGTGGGGWTDNGTVVGLTMPSDTVALNTTARLGKLNLNGNVGLNGESGIFFGNTNNFLQATMGENLTLRANNDLKTYAAGGLTMLAADNINIGHLGDASWIKVDNASKRFGVGMGTATSVDDRFHVKNDLAASCWMRVESAHPTNWGQAGLRIKTPQNMWNLRMDLYSNANLPDGALSLFSQDGYAESMTWLEDGRVGIGTSNPARKLHVNGSVQVNDTLYAGRIQPSLLSASRLPDEPGIAASTTSHYAYLQVGFNWSPIDSVAITVPAAGYVVGIVCAAVQTLHTYLDYGTFYIGLSTSPTSAGSYQNWHVHGQLPSGAYDQSLSVNQVFRVAAAGTYKFYSLARSTGDDVFHVSATATTCMYFPTAYGEAPSAMMLDMGNEAPATTPAWMARATASERKGDQPPDDFDSLRNQVQRLTRELQALRDEVRSPGK